VHLTVCRIRERQKAKQTSPSEGEEKQEKVGCERERVERGRTLLRFDRCCSSRAEVDAVQEAKEARGAGRTGEGCRRESREDSVDEEAERRKEGKERLCCALLLATSKGEITKNEEGTEERGGRREGRKRNNGFYV
jgi:hypothetical protein